MPVDVTIIVPIYNGAKYLSPFMDSVLAQDYSAFTMICIDDGSDDVTYEILCEYAKRDDRIHIYQNNIRKGAAYSRNLGLKMAKTEYVAFQDADDIVETDYISQLFCTIQENKADIAFCEQNRFKDQESNISCKPLNTSFSQKAFAEKFHMLDINVNDAVVVAGNPGVYIFRKSFVDKHHLRFQDLSSSNDTYFLEMAKILADGMVHVQETRALVHQRQHYQTSRISYNRIPLNAYRAVLAVKHKLEELNLWEHARQYYVCRVQRILATAVKDIRAEEDKVQFLDFLQREGLRELGFNEELLDCDYLRRDKKYICSLFLHGNYQDIEAIEPFETAVRANVDRIRKLLASWKGKKIAFWGIGYRWECLYRWCSSEMRFEYFLTDIYKAGQLWNDIEVIGSEIVAEKAEVVVVLNDLFLDDISQKIQSVSATLPVFSMDKFIMMEMPMEKCWS